MGEKQDVIISCSQCDFTLPAMFGKKDTEAQWLAHAAYGLGNDQEINAIAPNLIAHHKNTETVADKSRDGHGLFIITDTNGETLGRLMVKTYRISFNPESAVSRPKEQF